MASNKYTLQPPVASNTVRNILAERCYVHNTYATLPFTDPTARTDGNDSGYTGANWNDLGIVQNSQVQLTYSKEVKYVETGIEKFRRGAYVTGKTAQAQFTLEQFDWGVFSKVSGLTASTWTHNSSLTGHKFNVGPDDLIRKSLLFIGVNKLDGMEVQTFCYDAALVFQIQAADDARVLQVTADLFAFDPAGGSSPTTYFTMYFMNYA